ncbi:MAG: ATP-binding protein [Drouetiella hepatica Uher 2000/2452]|jgi:hypothetical protein|uniref:ATP-binding protein n=1 Tax=Drouetiella hepatica Uher 2000/2452 TaxID=904376 RepID=A0A951QDZ3_9CYAN|nr:ATP-binding protein [Drouetiella hepatica Uher 2000/2452]
MSYNPFDKAVGEPLQPEDLQTLITRQVAEGYYVEYKGEMPNSTKIGRSLASLANTYGGWYIVGIKTDEHNVAAVVSGFDPASCHDPISVVRDLVKHHIDPVPVFFPQVITLDTGNLVLVVHIPDKQETPFITRDGRLYRRTHDSSDPIPESSRYAVDQLVERGKEVSKQFARFSKDDRTFSNAEEDGWLKIYISPYPLGLTDHPDVRSKSVIEGLLKASEKAIQIPLFSNPEATTISGNIAFNAAHPTPSSVVLRLTNIQNEAFHSLTMELDSLGRAKIFIPLSQIELQDFSKIRSPIVRQQILDRLEIKGGRHHTSLKFFNVGTIWLTIAFLANYYLEWLGETTSLTDFQVALELNGVWRHVPFYDFDSWGEHVQQLGLPVLMRDYVRFPKDEEKGLFIGTEDTLWLHLCLNFGLACGLPPEFFANSIGTVITDAAGLKD